MQAAGTRCRASCRSESSSWRDSCPSGRWFDFEYQVARRDLYAGRSGDAFDAAIDAGGQFMLHFHRLEHGEPVALLHLGAFCNADVRKTAMHWREQQALACAVLLGADKRSEIGKFQ